MTTAREPCPHPPRRAEPDDLRRPRSRPSSCRRRSSSTRPSNRTGPTPTSRRSRRPSTGCNEFAGAWRAAQRPGGFFSPQAAGAHRAPRRLPRRRLRRRQDPPARRALARRAGPQVLRHLHRVHGAGRRARLRAGGRSCCAGRALVCIDEFELDDPGDTMLMTRLPRRAHGRRHPRRRDLEHAAERARRGPVRRRPTSCARSTRSPSNFETLRIDGLDYRRRDTEGHAEAIGDDAAVAHTAEALAARGHRVSLDGFDELIAHLATVHPSKYIKLIDGRRVHRASTGVHELPDQNDALRLVAFIDRVYDAEVPIVASGVPLDQVFDDEMMAGGYRKKYLRAMSPHDRAHHGGAAPARVRPPRGIRSAGADAAASRECTDSRRSHGRPKPAVYMQGGVRNEPETQLDPSRNVPS